MTTPFKYRLRQAEIEDIPHCLEVDTSYVTNHVWQMSEDYEDPGWLDEPELPRTSRQGNIVGKPDKNSTPAFHIHFTPSRLPRPLAMPAPWGEQQLLGEWKRTDFLVVAEAYDPAANGPETRTPPEKTRNIIGYLGLTVDGPRNNAWVSSGGVQIDFRRRGIGRDLLNEARRWADRYRFRSLMLELQTKNHPAINFCQHNGFFFCGYNSSYYASREIAIFFALRLEKAI